VLLLVLVLGFGAWQWRQFPAGLLPVAGAPSKHHDHDDD
jgi:hypothetical protein